jgi:hypothetical protein
VKKFPHLARWTLKLSQDLKSPIIENSNSSPARTSAAVVSVARIDPRIGSYAVIQFKKFPAICEVAHTPPGIGKLYAARLPAAAAWSVPLEGAVPRASLWSHSVPRVELDHRSREASLRLQQIERLLKPPVRVRHSRFLRLVYLLNLGTFNQFKSLCIVAISLFGLS